MTRYSTDDTRIVRMHEVTPPEQLIADLPLDDACSEVVFRTRREIAAALKGESSRLVVVVGPCSIHDPTAALEYADRLRNAARDYASELLLVMRVYFEKPRTTVGWKGLINDPHLDGTYDIDLGLRIARKLLVDLARQGVASATEYLDPITPQYLGDVVSWGAIGARTTESQIHRQLASGLSCPVGFKNGTDGSVKIAIDAITSAAAPHIFLSVTKQGHCAIFETSGNTDCHLILRGGNSGANYARAAVQSASELLAASGSSPRLMIDCSHGNSQKDFRRQPLVVEDIAAQLREGDRAIFGVMIESNLIEGRQDVVLGKQPRYGQSITDACIGWDDTRRCLDVLAEAMRRRKDR